MDAVYETQAELSQRLLAAHASTMNKAICQWCCCLVPDGHAYCEPCYDMIMAHKAKGRRKNNGHPANNSEAI